MRHDHKPLVYGLILALTLGLGCSHTAMVASHPETSAEIVDAMVEAHGGMERWAAAPTVYFEDYFTPAGAPSGAPSQVTVEQGRRRAYHDFPGTPMPMTLAWDGERAWSVNWGAPFPPRFMALLNYHFLNLPWLAKDPGVHLGEPGTGRLWDEPAEYVTIRLTYGEGVGDTPKDYYVLYIDPETYRLRACEYVVTYRSLLPEGTEATPPNILVYDEFETVDGLVVPTHFTIYQKEGKTLYFTCEIKDWSFTRPFDESRMVMPEGAVVDTSVP